MKSARDIVKWPLSDKAALAQERKKLNILAEMFGEVLFEYDIATDSMHYTKSRDEKINDKLVTIDYTQVMRNTSRIHPEDADKMLAFCEDLQQGKPNIYAEMRNQQSDGRYHWLKIEGKTVTDDEGRPWQVVGRMKNIDMRKVREGELLIGAGKDPLTGLYNLQTTVTKLRKELGRLQQEQQGWLLLVDIDDFEQINNNNGHLVGDAVICLVADELQELFNTGLIGRVNGDAYAVFVRGLSRGEIEARLDKLNSTVGDVYRGSEQQMEVSCSIGAAMCTGPQEMRRVFEWADHALYQIKQSGKRGYVIETVIPENKPEAGYLSIKGGKGSEREEASIRNADDLIVFALELLGNISDTESGLKMVSDRICGFFGIDHIVYISLEEDGGSEKRFHWSRVEKKAKDDNVLYGTESHFKRILEYFKTNDILVLRREMIEIMPERLQGSALLIRQEKGDGNGCLIFVDESQDRDWQEEIPALKRLGDVYFNCLQISYEKEKALKEMEVRIHTDQLTGLLRYRRFIMRAQQYLQERMDKNCYLVYSDFENFRYVNELYGYQEGDKILKRFADALRTVPGGILFCRINSDHFIGLLEGESDEKIRAAYLNFTKEFCNAINREYDRNNLVLVSGICHVEDHKEVVSAYIDGANSARKHGKNTTDTVVVVYDQDIKKKNEAEKTIIASMNSALESGEFHAWLQPKVSITTGKIVGAEALVRWIHSDGSMVYPDEFIPIFEKNGFITKIDFEVLSQILDYLRIAMDMGEEVVPVSVNFSRRHNEDSEFVDNLLAKVREKEIPPKYIEAEITESIFMLDLSALTGNLRRLKDAGIAISIDDFGSGYSSLNVLAKVEADIIKLDKKFLGYGDHDEKAPIFVKNLVKMMKSMGYKVVSEGVETESQLTFLKNTECDMVQGYYYARPMPIPEFRKFLREFNG